MPEYQLQIKQVVDYPRCRIYRQFVHRLMADRSIRASGGSGLFYFTVLCSYANFRTSYRRIDGISYTIYPGEWVCTLKEVSQWFRTRFQCQALTVLEQLQKQHFITFQTLDRGNVIRYKICDWARHNTVLEYNAPCQKDTGFFFLPVSVVTDLISTSRCSEMDIILDLWVSAVYNDNQVQGSDLGPVVYFRNGTGNPLVAYTELAVRWGLSRATVGRVLKKLAALDYISLMSFPGRHGSVVYLKNYLSTMFEISDVMVDKEEVAMTLNIRLELPDESGSSQNTPSIEHEVIVSNELNSVSKSHIEIIIQKMAQILMAQGISCFGCPLSRYKLYPYRVTAGKIYYPACGNSQRSVLACLFCAGTDRSPLLNLHSLPSRRIEQGGLTMKKFVEKDVAENPLYHDTWKLLKKYRDVVWSLEISVQHVRSKFEIEYGTSIEEFLDSIYLAGADLNGSDIEHHAKCIERSHKMLKLLDSAVELLRTRHKNGEAYYWLLYYSFLSPQQLKNVEEIIENLRPHIRDISFRTYYRRRREAIDALSSVLWGYTSKDSLDMLEQFFPAPKPDEKAKGK